MTSIREKQKKSPPHEQQQLQTSPANCTAILAKRKSLEKYPQIHTADPPLHRTSCKKKPQKLIFRESSIQTLLSSKLHHSSHEKKLAPR
jgi:hypothetical protein